MKNEFVTKAELVDYLVILIDMIEHPEHVALYDKAVLQAMKAELKGNKLKWDEYVSFEDEAPF
jgi:hypothetical protein